MNLIELRSRLSGETLPMVVTTPGMVSVPVRYIQKAGCRKYVMRLKGGHLQVTLPQRYSVQEAQNFLKKNLEWIDAQLARVEAQPKREEGFGIGSKVLLRGEWVEVLRGEEGSSSFVFAGELFPMKETPKENKYAIYNHIYEIAWKELPELTRKYAEGAGLKVSRVTVRNQKSRWGSCSTRAAISLNWRLIQTPDFVRDYIIYHELMHLKHMNHSAKYWAAVEEVYPEYRRAEQWLKEHNNLLRS